MSTIGRTEPTVHRVLVAGISGAGKTTLAMQLAALLGLPRHELDALHHGPGWVKRLEFEADVARFSAEPSWICEDQYQGLLGELLWERADTVVWLDLPRRTVMRRVAWRTARRLVTREELYNGNRERWRALLDPGHPVRWAWTRHADRARRTAELATRHPHVQVIRLRSPRAVDAWLRSLSA